MIRLLFIFMFLLQLPLYGQDAIVLKQNYNYEIKSKKLSATFQIDVQINNKDGESYGDIYIPYTKGDKVSIDYIQIEDMNGGVIRKIKGNEMTVRSSISDISLYEDDLVKFINIRHNVFPYRVISSYTVESSKFLMITSFNSKYISVPIIDGKLSISVPPDYPIKYKSTNAKDPEIQTINKLETYSWTYSSANQSYRKERNSLIESDKNVEIKAVPVQINYGAKGSQNTWSDLGKWIADLNKDKQELPISEQQVIDKLVADIDNPREKVKVLYKYLQDNNRYINVSINHGGLQTYPASYVVANRYGDCKALTNYMQAMLKYVNITSFYTLINAGSKIEEIDMNFPSQVFNHVILTVPIDGDSIFVECTSKNNSFDYLGTFTQGRKALLIDSIDSYFISTPTMSMEDVLCTRNMNIDLTSNVIDIEVQERGEDYETSNFIVNELNKNRQEKYIRNNILGGSYDLEEFHIEPIKNAPEINVYAKCKMHNFTNKYGKNLVVNSLPIDIPSYETPSIRKKGVQLDYPAYYVDTLDFDLGEMKIKNLPSEIDNKTKYGHYRIEYTLKDNNIVQQRKTLIINKGKYTIEEYPDFYKFLSSTKSSELQNIIFEIL